MIEKKRFLPIHAMLFQILSYISFENLDISADVKWAKVNAGQ